MTFPQRAQLVARQSAIFFLCYALVACGRHSSISDNRNAEQSAQATPTPSDNETEVPASGDEQPPDPSIVIIRDGQDRTIFGIVLSVAEDGVLCASETFPNSVRSTGTPFFIKGRFNYVDGDQIHLKVIPAGRYRYTTAAGTVATVRAFKAAPASNTTPSTTPSIAPRRRIVSGGDEDVFGRNLPEHSPEPKGPATSNEHATAEPSWQGGVEVKVVAVLGIRDKFGTLGSYDAVFIVTTPDNERVSKSIHTSESRSADLVFPDDFNTRWGRLGTYRWSAQVNGREVLYGSFQLDSRENGGSSIEPSKTGFR